MSTEKNQVIVELYDLSITDRKDDRFGRVLTSKSLNEDDLIRIAVDRRTDLSPTTLKASIEILREIAKEQLANGASVAFGLGYFNVKVNGVFLGDNARWDSDKHQLSVRVIPTAEVRAAVKSAAVNVRGMASAGICINTVTDVASGEVNTKLTPGGVVNVSGSKIRILGDDPAVGIWLINEAAATSTRIAPNAIALNEPSKLMFVVPSNLAPGDYQLQVTTQYSNGTTLLKVPRSSLLEYILTV